MNLTSDVAGALMVGGVDVRTPEDIMNRPAWMADGACLEHPELSWFPTAGERVDEQRAICAACLVRDECIDYSLQLPTTTTGLWGGVSERGRRLIRRGAQRSSATARGLTGVHTECTRCEK